tara:strand:- start:1230 stop:1499 length:270 start_codon:yes stop_codon:yes gene_type:complete
MVNAQWGWGHSHKGVVGKARLLLLSMYREAGWASHRQELIDEKDMSEVDYKERLKEMMWHLEDEGKEDSQKYKDVDKLYKYMGKHRGSG